MTAERALLSCQRWLCAVWILGVFPPFLLMSVQTLHNYYGLHDQDAWGWLLTATMPTFSLVIGSYISSAMEPSAARKSIESAVFLLSMTFSGLYLLVVNGILFFLPFSSISPLDAMHHLNLLLGALQGLVGTCLGVFFTRHRKGPSKSVKG